MTRHRCSECGTRHASCLQHVRDWHGWPYTAQNPYNGEKWLPVPVLLSRVNGARPQNGRLWCALPTMTV